MTDTSVIRRQKTLESLETYYSEGVEEGRYLGHQPVYGFNGPGHEAYQMVFLARVFHILNKINTFQFDSFLDVGGGEGYTANLVQKIFGGYCVSADISLQANLRARQLFNLDSLAADASRLPFSDGAFDLVLCSEVIEHLEHPANAIQELLRVSRKGLIISSMEAALSLFERKLRIQLRDLDEPHAEFNWWHPSDFSLLLGSEGLTYSHILNVREYANAGYDDKKFTENTAWELIGRMHQDTAFGTPYGRGILVVKRQNGAKPISRMVESELLTRAAAVKLPLDYQSFPESDWVSDELSSRLRCPVNKNELMRQQGGICCESCDSLYPVTRGIPNMIPSQVLTNDNPSDVEKHFATLFAISNIAGSPVSHKICSGLIRCMERTRSYRASRSRPPVAHG